MTDLTNCLRQIYMYFVQKAEDLFRKRFKIRFQKSCLVRSVFVLSSAIRLWAYNPWATSVLSANLGLRLLFMDRSVIKFRFIVQRWNLIWSSWSALKPLQNTNLRAGLTCESQRSSAEIQFANNRISVCAVILDWSNISTSVASSWGRMVPLLCQKDVGIFPSKARWSSF